MNVATAVIFSLSASVPGVLAAQATEQSGVSANSARDVARPRAAALAMLHTYASCLADKRPKIVRQTLALDFRSEAYAGAMRDIGDGPNACMTEGRLRFGQVLLAGGLAEAVLKRDYAGKRVDALLPADWTAKPIESRSESEYAALCVVQRQPEAVQTLLGTEAQTAAELAAFRPLLDALPNCMQKGSKLAIDRPFYRAILALALYRAAMHFTPSEKL